MPDDAPFPSWPGYQGWFRAPHDTAGLGWIHWSRDRSMITPSTLSFDVWPDMAEYPTAYPAAGFTLPNRTTATLFSSADASTVDVHFRWLKEHNIGGVWHQRFLVGLKGGTGALPSFNTTEDVRHHIMEASVKHSRGFAMAYDTAGMPEADIFKVLTEDWVTLEAEGLPTHPQYLRYGGKPVVVVEGFYPGVGQHDPMTAQTGRKLVSFLRGRGVFVVGLGTWTWRTLEQQYSEDWKQLFRSFDAYVPWNIGNWLPNAKTGEKEANTQYWEEDAAEMARHGVLYVPSVYPGFSWSHLDHENCSAQALLPRYSGRFYWRQWYAASRLNLSSVYVAMFDEVDEGTAVFKIADAPAVPTQSCFVGDKGCPSDWYLTLTTLGTAQLHTTNGRRRGTDNAVVTSPGTIPVKPLPC